MSRPVKLLAIAFVLGVACGNPRPAPVANATTAPSATSAPTSAPTPSISATPRSSTVEEPTPPKEVSACKSGAFPPTAETNRRLALVNLTGAQGYVVRDITDINHPFTIANLGYGISVPRFVNGGEISYSVDCGYARSPLTGSPLTQVAASTDHVNFAFTWTADGTTLIYLSDTATGNGLSLHQVKGGHDRVFASGMPSIPAVGCESEFCSLGDVTLQLTYSPDESKISFVENLIGVRIFRVWTSDGKVLVNSDSSNRDMPAWSGTGFYFRDAAGVEVWRDGKVSPFLPAVSWSNPTGSPDGGSIAYATNDSGGFSHVWMVDVATRTVRELKAARSAPVFLTGRYLWYTGERACVGADHCPSGWNVVSNGRAYIYDLQTGAESGSVITNVYDIWPRTA